MFNQIMKNQKKEQQKKLKKANEKIDGVVQSFGKLLDEKGVSYYEMIDITYKIQGVCNTKLTQILISNGKQIIRQNEQLINKENEIDELNSKINLYASSEPKESPGEEDK